LCLNPSIRRLRPENIIIRLFGGFRGKMTYSITTGKRNQPQIARGQINYPLKKRIRLQNLICSQHYVQITAELALKPRSSFKKNFYLQKKRK
jgi:hypothetical protein